MTFIGRLDDYLAGNSFLAPTSFSRKPALHDSIGYPRMSASGESSTTMHRLLHASGSHPIPPPDDPKDRVGGRRTIRLIFKEIETVPVVRHAPPLTHMPNSPTLTYTIDALYAATL
ncbi:hypothetical protein F511_23356 [Dorcoceras hygrometricum]|uniref:Uncharacterized protein n=1 Tax=Dorcoceras hygrometricum TaxID=472368 RepID=A0A2Z7CG94_9LAMI|nr:hypothetical protein F511_23356 [Dorcoceras hygrometricum]